MFDSEDRIKMALFTKDLDEGAQSAKGWALLCAKISKEGSAHDAFEKYEQKYLRAAASGGHDKLLSTLRNDMLDNYIVGAFAAKNVGVPKDAPLIAWNAQNRFEFEGWRGEIATIRTLIWAGYDPSGQDEGGATALHYMVNMRYGSGCNPRAVRILLEAGCDPNLAHNGGDTPLITLCGHVEWGVEHSKCLGLLVEAGANLCAASPDGATPLSLLSLCDKRSPNEERQWLIGAIEAGLE